MEAPEEAMMGSNDLTHIVKGKRTKRQRAASPLTVTMNNNTSASSSSAGGGGGGGGGSDGAEGMGEDDCNYMPSPTTSSTELLSGHESTEEEEDMANCLILLAQGQGRETPKRIQESGGGRGGGTMERSGSRRFAEAAGTNTNTNTHTTAGKVGFYGYECKTCNRCFPSFQALGGHRASHKKPKAASAMMMMMVDKVDNNNINKKASSSLMALSPEEDENPQHTYTYSPPLPFSLQKMPNHFNVSSCNSRAMYSTNNKSRVHECSICGSEFTSGQALGGHMRRHRSAATATTTNNNMMPVSSESPDDEEANKPRNGLQLDLNLPAPSDDDHHHRESNFSFASKQQPPPPPLVFSASALVDCHY